MDKASPLSEHVISVSELNRQARVALERNLPSCWVRGEIGNYSRAASGHWYFTLKDEQSSVRCAMFRPRNQFIDWQPRDGEQVEVRAQPTLYEQRGDYQLLVDSMRRAGQGSVFEAFLKLKAKLEAEGLFSSTRKRVLPAYPRSIGLITSHQAAALRDVLTTLRSRWPVCHVILYPAPVQGEDAPTRLVAAINVAAERRECDCLLLVRGGGSLEDLSAFNDERVARAIASCPLPIVSGVGHETDFTITDFVADVRAPTPTGAAQSATPSKVDLNQHLQHLRARLDQSYTRKLHALEQRLDSLLRRVIHPRERIVLRRQRLVHARWRIAQAMKAKLHEAKADMTRIQAPLINFRNLLAIGRQAVGALRMRMETATHHFHSNRREHAQVLRSHLEMLNPAAVLQRGYSIVRDSMRHVIRTSQQVKIGQSVDILLASGTLQARVTDSKATPE